MCCYNVQLWELETGKLVYTFDKHTGPVNSVQFHPTEHLLASGSSDKYADPAQYFLKEIVVML